MKCDLWPLRPRTLALCLCRRCCFHGEIFAAVAAVGHAEDAARQSLELGEQVGIVADLTSRRADHAVRLGLAVGTADRNHPLRRMLFELVGTLHL